MIFNATASTTRDGWNGTVLTNVRVNKSHDVLTLLPEGPVLLATVLTPPGMDWQNGDYMTVVGATQSAYKVWNVEDRSGDLIPELRITVRATMQG